MSVDPGEAGKSRACPHLASAGRCPMCRHYLRSDRSSQTAAGEFPFQVEGTIKNDNGNGPWEYSVMLSIKNDKGEEVARQVVGVGALQPDEARTFTFAVEVFKPGAARAPAPKAGTTVRPVGPPKTAPVAPASSGPAMPPNLRTIKPPPR